MVTRRHSLKSTEPEKKGQTDREFKDRSAELGVSFDEFYKKFKPSLNAILAKARRLFSETLGNHIEAEWESAADKALVKAYMKYPATGGKAELKTYASKAVVNAINSVNRKHKRNFKKTGGNISLDQTNDQREKLAEMVGDGGAVNPNAVSLTADTEKALKMIAESNLTNDEKKILNLRFAEKKAHSTIRRSLGKKFDGEYISEEEYRLKMAVIADKLTDMGIMFSRKRLHQQINPVVRDGVVRDEYADLLSVKEYTPETLEKWSNAAMAWILKQGGVKPAAEQFLKNHAPAEKHVATLARRMIINSDVYANAFSYEQIQYWGHSHRSYPHFAAAVFSVFPARQKKPLSTSASRNVGTDRERFQEKFPASGYSI